MQIIVRGHKLKITPAIRRYAQKKMQKMSRFFSNIQEVLVELEVQQIKNKAKRQVAHVTINLSQGILRANESDQDIYTALDKVFDKMEKQVKKHHEKLKTRRQAMKNREVFKGNKLVSEDNPKKNFYHVKIVTQVGNPIKPMDPQEAVLEHKLYNDSFFIFKNARNGSMNILYKIENKGFGLYYTEPVTEQGNIWQRFFRLFKKEDPTYGEKAIIDIKPLGRISNLSPTEAIDYLKDKNLSYYIFRNINTKRINIIYPLTEPAGCFGLIESAYKK
ncbi:MAG: ribosome-associated translation inhibitor RaiA [Candidatus Margulisbacteria bacterium]|nr:ribosome-associated translation inhibitor RaiA [Candidatus Margulisiibacteriota bacterium]